ncbi:magnesium and cobalt transport protein CorA [Flexistipes sinusarabici DSM 4947]|uniref:Magnesium transport protein CorA n=1 Tax=Flexistipes sinusarabici (strain ATCC 49648 / DSM 4947 / MAS 10) TaxID=717231 RepID=F8E6P4_FLESM|nr:magnesium/cobalt transporter CorA [Flexistipes sinusarabici]AEI15934.1 magnesium and cobalt transport protein CorA [Flexistipes sinusarabici DSM 4947]
MKGFDIHSALKRTSKKFGKAPGTLEYTGDYKAEPTSIIMYSFDTESFSENEVDDVQKLKRELPKGKVNWIRLHGFRDIPKIRQIGQIFDINSLVLEDALNPYQRAKVEDMGNYLYITLKVFEGGKTLHDINAHQMNIILMDNCVITLNEAREPYLDLILDRIKRSEGRIRGKGHDYFVNAVVDLIVDSYFIVLEGISDNLENLEKKLREKDVKDFVGSVYDLRRLLTSVRRAIWPIRDIVAYLDSGASKLVSDEIKFYIKDIYDHIMHLIETVESLRDVTASLLDLHMTDLSNRMNEIMKMLTIISTLFIPLTFIVGVYGMNFKYMPELDVRWAYPVVWLVMIIIAGLMLLFFKKKDWI